MKVLQINAVYGVGSTGMIVEEIHKLCFARGIESYVAYSSSNLPPADIPNGYKIGTVAGKKVHALLCRMNGMQAYYSRWATKRLIRHIEMIRPDIVQLHNLHSNFIHLNMLLKYLAKRKIHTVVTLHDCWFYTGGCFHYTAVGCSKWQAGCGNCPKKKQDTPAYLFDRSAKVLADRKKYFSAIPDLTVVGVSKWIAREAEKTFFGEKEITHIHNGVDLDVYKPVTSDFKERYGVGDRFMILGLASKWLAPINKATLETVVSGMGPKTCLVLLGCTDEQMDALPENVIGLPFIKDKTELCKIYTAADVFANCTREDTLCFVNIESQACGTPVVTYSNTGAQETVDGLCGFAVKNGDPNALLKCIMDVNFSGEQNLSNSCRELVKKEFCDIINYENYLNLYQKIITK